MNYCFSVQYMRYGTVFVYMLRKAHLPRFYILRIRSSITCLHFSTYDFLLQAIFQKIHMFLIKLNILTIFKEI